MSAFPPKLPWIEIYVRSGLKNFSERVGQRPIVRRVRGAVDDLRETVRNAARQRLAGTTAVAEQVVRRMLDEKSVGPSCVVNATGVIAPSGLALPLAEPAISAMNSLAGSYSEELLGIETLLADLTGAPAALVLHSSATAVLATLQTLGGPVVAARQHVGDIDGLLFSKLTSSLDIPLFEAGTIGRISLDDYRADLSRQRGGCLWYSHPQSVQIEGDVAAPSADELFAVAHDNRCLVIEYLESAMLVDVNRSAVEFKIPLVGASLLAGADLVIFPGDRFVGGPSCGIIIGRRDLVARIAENTLARAAKVDASRLASLAVTLQLTSSRETMMTIPTLQLLYASAENLHHRAERLAAQIAGAPGVVTAAPIECPTYPNDGRLASQRITGWGVAITTSESPQIISQKLADHHPKIKVSLNNDGILLNLRSVLPRQDEQLAMAFQAQN